MRAARSDGRTIVGAPLVGARGQTRQGGHEGRPYGRHPALVLALMFIVVSGHSQRMPLRLHAKSPGHCRFIVYYNEPP
jgi:hypothetical protein